MKNDFPYLTTKDKVVIAILQGLGDETIKEVIAIQMKLDGYKEIVNEIAKQAIEILSREE